MIPCATCGHQISKGAAKCPKCGGLPSECLLCHQSIRTGELYSHPSEPNTFHQSCIRHHFQIPPALTCPDCGVCLASTSLQDDLSKFVRKIESLPCPNCGSPHPLGKRGYFCYICDLPIYSAFQPVVWGPYLIRGTISNSPVHDFCLATLPQPPPAPSPTQPTPQQSASTGCIFLLCLFVAAVLMTFYHTFP